MREQLALCVQVTGDHGQVRSLHRWLVRDPELVGVEHQLVAGEPEPGAMSGGALEVISVVLSNSIALSSLLLTVANWRASRGGRVEVRVERAGVVVTVAANSPEAVQQMANALMPNESPLP